MNKNFKGAILALGLIGASLSTAGTASAGNVGISINLGDVAFAYQDGYWDQGHRWHRWRNAHEARDYRARPHNHYHAWNRDRDRDHDRDRDRDRDHDHDRGWHDRN